MPWDIDKGGGRIYRQPVETNPDKFVKDKEIQRIMRVIGVPKRYQQCRLDKVPDNVDYRAGLMIFVETLVERDKRGDGLLMFGSYGTGKTGASVSVLYEAIKRGCRCRFVSARDLGRIAFDFEESQKDRWADLRRYQLVVLDEMGVE
jgi:DNA replication protein DnaC